MCDFYITQVRDVHWKVNNMTEGFKNNKRVYFHIMRAMLNLFISFIGETVLEYVALSLELSSLH